MGSQLGNPDQLVAGKFSYVGYVGNRNEGDKALREEGGSEERYDISRARVFARISTVFATLLSNYFEREDTYKYVACRAQYTTSALADDKHAVSGLTLE